jgi:hypothetical protein
LSHMQVTGALKWVTFKLTPSYRRQLSRRSLGTSVRFSTVRFGSGHSKQQHHQFCSSSNRTPSSSFEREYSTACQTARNAAAIRPADTRVDIAAYQTAGGGVGGCSTPNVALLQLPVHLLILFLLPLCRICLPCWHLASFLWPVPLKTGADCWLEHIWSMSGVSNIWSITGVWRICGVSGFWSIAESAA